ncbi:RICIN domain-containing protein [Solirubrobacter soli]|uniref:RICIN domain-containing protein n=1 Tax=Solirubrobacter soli TaxID=363832 RepID=UPI0004253B72|nr:RICIN domain-containing protein [Solirubrobacter soli]
MITAVPQKLVAALFGAVLVLTLALSMSARAEAADVRVELVNKLSGEVLAPKTFGGIPQGSVGLSFSGPHLSSHTWVKEAFGNAAIYHQGNNTSRCLTASTSSNLVTTQPCNHGQNQLWAQGLESGCFRELRNLKSSRSLNAQDAKQNGTTFSELVDQQFFTGASRMLWQVHVL